MRIPRRKPSRSKRRLPFYHELIEDDRGGGGGGGGRGGEVGRAGASRSRRLHSAGRFRPGPNAASTALSRATGHNAVVKVDFGTEGTKRLLLRFSPVTKL